MQASADDLGIDLNILYTPTFHRSESFKNTIKLLESADKPDYLIAIFQKRTTLKLLRLSEKHQVDFYSINTQVPEESKACSGKPREFYKYWLGHSVPNDKLAGYLAAKDLIASFKKNNTKSSIIQLLAISGGRDSSASFDRNTGLFQALKEHPDVTINQLVHTDWSTSNAYIKTKGLLKRYPKTNIIWAANDAIALGVSQAITGQPIITAGIDWSKKGITAVQEGKLLSTYGGHFAEGGLALVMLYDYFHGLDFIKDPGLSSYTSFAKIDLTNIDHFNTILTEQNWQSINFRNFSKAINPSLDKYDFSWENMFRNIE